MIFSGALIDQRPDAHHPATAAEALLHLEQIQHKDKRNQMQQPQFTLNIPAEWSDVVVSSPHNVSRALNNFHNTNDDYNNSIREIRSHRTFATSSSMASWSNQSSIELDQLEANGETPTTATTTAAAATAGVPQDMNNK